jgi:CheY-like chemotaxis protein
VISLLGKTNKVVMAENNLTEQYPGLKKKLVLNVDDNDMNQLVLTKILLNAGVRVITAENGAAAIRKLHEGLKPDVILLDLEMPVMNGIQTAEFIKGRIDCLIPIIINSGLVTAYERWKLKRIGIEEFLLKPYTIEDIFLKLAKNLAVIPV